MEIWLGLIVLFGFLLYLVYKDRVRRAGAKEDSFSKWHREQYNVSVEECPECRSRLGK